jgi:integrase/recombinase XerD
MEWVLRGTKADAEAFEARKRVELETTAPETTQPRVVPTFLDFCVTRYRPHAELHLKAYSWEKQSYLLARLAQDFGSAKLNEINHHAVETYARRRIAEGLRPVSVNNELRALRRVLNFAREECKVPIAAPAWSLLPERGKRRVRAWTAEEVARLIDVCAEISPDILPLVVFLANTGTRRGEALALTWDNVDLTRRQIRIWPSEEWQPKNNKEREVPISDALFPWLAGARLSEKWVFPSLETRERYVHWPKRQFDRARKAAGLTGGPHTLRHSFATHFLAGCPDLFLLARVLGHSDVAVTRLYAHLLKDRLARARNVVSFASPIGPAALAAQQRWGEVLLVCELEDHDIAAPDAQNLGQDLGQNERGVKPSQPNASSSLERETGLEPATLSLGIRRRPKKNR